MVLLDNADKTTSFTIPKKYELLSNYIMFTLYSASLCLCPTAQGQYAILLVAHLIYCILFRGISSVRMVKYHLGEFGK